MLTGSRSQAQTLSAIYLFTFCTIILVPKHVDLSIMASRFLSAEIGNESGSSESSEGEEDLWIETDNKLNLSNNELDADTFEVVLTNMITDEAEDVCSKV